jgi:hypothetical protein
MKKLLLIALALVLVLVISALLYWRHLKSPAYSLVTIQRAFQQHDLATFEKYVDIESVSTRALADLPDIFGTQKELGLFGEQTAEVVLALVKEPFVNIIKQAVRTFVERGYFDKSLTQQGSLSRLLNLIPTDSIKLVSLQKIKKEGKICRAPLRVHIGSFDGDATIQFMLRNKGGYWQVAEVCNLSEFVHEVLELQRTYPSRDLKGTCLYFATLMPQKDHQAQALASYASALSQRGSAYEADRYFDQAAQLALSLADDNMTTSIAKCEALTWVCVQMALSGKLVDATNKAGTLARVKSSFPGEGGHNANDPSFALVRIASELLGRGKIKEFFVISKSGSLKESVDKLRLG